MLGIVSILYFKFTELKNGDKKENEFSQFFELIKILEYFSPYIDGLKRLGIFIDSFKEEKSLSKPLKFRILKK